MSKSAITAILASIIIFPGALGYYNTGAPARAESPALILPAGAVPAGQWAHRPGLSDYETFIKKNK